MTIDGFESPVELHGTLRISGDTARFDWSGSSSLSRFGINVPLNYTTAMTDYALACAIAPDVPNNEGVLSAFDVAAPEGSILNALRPHPVACRHIVGLLLPDVVFGCFDQLKPGHAPVEGASTQWALTFRGGSLENSYTITVIVNGGSGARPGLDGMSATSFPSNVRGTPTEIVEHDTPLIFWRRELREKSGGDGCWRGGLGQDLEIGTTDGTPFTLFAGFDRIENPARGRSGGKSGLAGELYLAGGDKLPGKGAHVIKRSQCLVIRTPGGGGYGDPRSRAEHDRAADQTADYT